MNTEAQAPYSLGLRLSWLFAAQTLVGFGLISVVIYAVAAWNLSGKADTELARKSELVKHVVAEAAGSGDVQIMRHKLNDFLIGHDDLRVTLLDRSGNVAYESAGSVGAEVMQRTAKFELPAEAAGAGLAQARIAMDRSDDGRLLAGLGVLLSITTVFGALVASLSGFWLVRRSLRPLHGLADQTRALRIGQLGQRLALNPAVEEVQPWVDQFNDLLGRLDYAYRQLEAFSADVAHELRTPLANLLGHTEVALLRQRTVEELRDTLSSNLEEGRRLTSIVNDMLFLAHADRGARATGSASASLRAEAVQVLEFHEGALAEHDLGVRIDGNAWASFDAGLIRRAISNLVSNAVRYADPGSELVLALSQRDGFAWLELRNRGAAISPAALPHLFDRFYRAQPSREGSRVNHGLGLAIVAAIARMHGGTTKADSAEAVTTIGFSLAIAPDGVDSEVATESPMETFTTT